MNDSDRIEIKPGLSERDLGDEMVIMDDAGQDMHSISESGIYIWNILREGCTFGELVKAMLEEFDAEEETIRGDLVEFLNELGEKGLII